MTKQTIMKFVSVAALGLLVVIFGLLLLVMAAPLFVPTPGIGGFAFAISRRAFTGALMAFLTVLAAALFFIARARRRRH